MPPLRKARWRATYGYSASTGQLTTVTSGARTVTYTYDAATGWLKQTLNPPLVAVRTPDPQGRLLSLTTHTGVSEQGPVISSCTYTYDAQGRRTQLVREDGRYWQYGYNGRSEVTSGVKYYDDGTAFPG